MAPSFDHTLHVGVDRDMLERIGKVHVAHQEQHHVRIPLTTIVRMLIERGLADLEQPAARPTRSRR